MIITAGIYKGRKVAAPDEKIVRPTLSKIRESIFNTLFSMMDFDGKSFLDMFAGSGIIGLEALSRGFENVLAIEKNPKAAKILKENYENIKIKPNLIIGDSLKQKLSEKFDVIYLDPPYFSGIYEKSLEKIKESSLLKEGGIVILEHVTEINFSDFGFKLIKQKKYSQKFVTFLSGD
ncbi:MAG: 16S rRNA (guanine(966)-N(2))-methyltransferase RsmD [Candidatus Gastranaerophilaceae bacterium]